MCIPVFYSIYKDGKTQKQKAKEKESIREQWQPPHIKKEYPVSVPGTKVTRKIYNESKAPVSYDEFLELLAVVENVYYTRDHYSKKEANEYLEWWIEKTNEKHLNDEMFLVDSLMKYAYLAGLLSNSFYREDTFFNNEECKSFSDRQAKVLHSIAP